VSTTTGPVALTSGQTSQVPFPASGVYTTVVVSNLSPFLLRLQLGGNDYWHLPWTAAKYPIVGTQAPILMEAQQVSGTFPAGSTQSVTATWYNQGEDVAGVFPISLVSNALAASISGGTITLSGQVPVVNGVPSPLAVSVTNPLDGAPSSGQRTIAVTGTAVQLPSLPASTVGVLIAALKANVQPIYLGPSSVTSSNGLELQPGSLPVLFAVDNSNRLWINGTSADGVSILAL
jgi:hypothetical protein